MNTIKLGNQLSASQVGLGMMRINKLTDSEVDNLIKTALEVGINFFEHANGYGGDKPCEEIFGRVVTSDMRDKMIVQTKCGMNGGMLDLSKEHIVSSVERSLKRLNTDHIDILALHRPDALVEPEEVAEAFDLLHSQGKVLNFGVSNHTAMQIALLKKYVRQPIIVNQMQLSVMYMPMITAGINANMSNEAGVNRDGGLLDYCRLNDINIQAWSPFQYGFFKGVFIDNELFPELNQKLAEIGEEHGVDKSAVAVAFLSRHPAKIQTIAGTTNAQRVRNIAKSSDFTMSRKEWYEIFKAAGNKIP